MTYTLYLIDCPSHDGGLVNGGAAYFGQTSQKLKSRLCSHGYPRTKCVRLNRWLAARRREGYTFRVIVLADGLSKELVDALEKRLISAHKTPKLLNITAGGEGTAGIKWTAERRQRKSDSLKGEERKPPEWQLFVKTLYLSGLSVKEVARRMSCSTNTVRRYCSGILRPVGRRKVLSV